MLHHRFPRSALIGPCSLWTDTAKLLQFGDPPTWGIARPGRSGFAGARKKAPANREGLFLSHSQFDFCDDDLMRSSNFKNSAVSSAGVFVDVFVEFLDGGLGGKGITSDMGEPPLSHIRAGPSLSCAIAAFLRRRFSSRARNAP